MWTVASELVRIIFIFLYITSERVKEPSIRGPKSKLRDWIVQELVAFFFFIFLMHKVYLKLRSRMQLRGYQTAVKTHGYICSLLDGLLSYTEQAVESHLVMTWTSWVSWGSRTRYCIFVIYSLNEHQVKEPKDLQKTGESFQQRPESKIRIWKVWKASLYSHCSSLG